jgi:hypothetical protein
MIDVFSGRHNPVFEIDDTRARSLLERTGARESLDTAEPQAQPVPALGYRGLLLEETATRVTPVPRRFRLASPGYGGPAGALASSDAIEDLLFAPDGLLSEDALGADLTSAIRREVRRAGERQALTTSRAEAEAATARAAVPVPECACAPIYEPFWWNDGSTRQLLNNCYNYSTNHRTDTFAQPGRASGAQYPAYTCLAVAAAAMRDGLLVAGAGENTCPDEGHLVALVVAPGIDFHWYRKGRDGMWSHKPGPNVVTDLDNSGQPIADPRTADRGWYTSFCGFMVVRHGHIKLQ